MNLNKVEKATLATALAIFENEISNPDNEVSNSNPTNALMTLIVIKRLILKLGLVEIYNELQEDAERRMNEDK